MRTYINSIVPLSTQSGRWLVEAQLTHTRTVHPWWGLWLFFGEPERSTQVKFYLADDPDSPIYWFTYPGGNEINNWNLTSELEEAIRELRAREHIDAELVS